MTILLITTLPNLVYNELQKLPFIVLHTIDCRNIGKLLGERIKTAVQNEIPDIILTYRCPYILPGSIFNMTQNGSYNIHPSLLPLYAGLNPWEDIFVNKETINGVTLHRITESVDQGEIIFQKKYIIRSTDSIITARDKADVIAAELALELLSLNFIG